MDIERLKAIERDTWNWIRAFGDQGAVTKEDFYALVTAIIANPEPVTPPPDEVVEALRQSDRRGRIGYGETLAAAVRDMSWALEHSANDCDTAEELERYIPICKTAHAVEEMNG